MMGAMVPTEAEMRVVAKTISDVRAEMVDRIRTDIETEVAALEADGYDPTRGRGRGPKWAEEA